MDRALSQKQLNKNKKKKISKLLIALTGIIALVILTPLILTSSININTIETDTVIKGNLETSISASGTVVPLSEEILVSPISSTIDKIFLTSGDNVKKGDSILSLNTEKEIAIINKLQDELELKKAKIERLHLDNEARRASQTIDKEIKELKLENLRQSLKDEKYLYSIGGTSAESVKKLETSVQIAELEFKLEKQQKAIQIKKEQNELKSLQLEYKIQENAISELQQTIANACIRANKAGTITWINDQIGSSVSSGQQMVKIADLNDYKISAAVSDMHADKLSPGGKIKVKDANNNIIEAEVDKITPVVENALINFTIISRSSQLASLRLNQSVEVFITTEFRNSCLLIKNAPFYYGAGEVELYVIENNTAYRRKVVVGKCNYDYVEVIAGLKEGEQVIIENMDKYKKVEKIKVKQ